MDGAMKARLFFVAVVAWLALDGTAMAQDVNLGAPSQGYTYFNRPGADLTSHTEDVTACMIEAARVSSQDQLAARRNGEPGTGLLGNLLIDAMTSGTRPAAIENCMVVRGLISRQRT
jgi:hypothetical protein